MGIDCRELSLRFNSVKQIVMDIQSQVEVFPVVLDLALEIEVFSRLDFLFHRFDPIRRPRKALRIEIFGFFDKTFEFRGISVPANHAPIELGIRRHSYVSYTIIAEKRMLL